ncbi:mandelate racemase/muconate lactonizing enzyme family protein [Salinibacterium soli]|uniref:Mandelate racemase/muconate lactonizing enzyme family protein n=1 Tax=Antiquaquibacter soli TaxID=3064523 RepID=A0ABT9BJK4_9MICO|nr:mandelate racemase/muconate lactonizing enzyme family protein [Protaetiibacter sp. WY-16]MDO7880613.1 mandelate racemase/muconate lactonizing enzyme family protein [Protaetiibacter sp. WY-16]
MRLRALTTYLCDAYRTNWVLVKLETEDGLHGWGEATLEYKEHAVEQAILVLEASLRGRDLGDIQGWWQEAYRDAYWRGGAVLTSALSAIEMALWDLKGKAAGMPVHGLLGGAARADIPCYANGWFAGARSPREFADKAVEAAEWGYRAIKWDPFGSAFRSLTAAELAASMRVVEAVASAVEGRAEIIIEAHGRFELPTAQRIAHALEGVDVLWLEEALIPGNLANYSRLKERTTTPLSLGERLYTRWDFREVFESGCADFVQPDVSHAGGIWETRMIGALAELWQVGFAPHNPSGPVANAATLQLAACSPNFSYLETMATDVPWRGEIATESSVIAHGVARVSDAPGLGVEIDEAALAGHPFVRHDLRHYSGALTDIRPADQAARHDTSHEGMTV